MSSTQPRYRFIVPLPPCSSSPPSSDPAHFQENDDSDPSSNNTPDYSSPPTNVKCVSDSGFGSDSGYLDSDRQSPPKDLAETDDCFLTEDEFAEQLDHLLLLVLQEREQKRGERRSALWDTHMAPSPGPDHLDTIQGSSRGGSAHGIEDGDYYHRSDSESDGYEYYYGEDDSCTSNMHIPSCSDRDSPAAETYRQSFTSAVRAHSPSANLDPTSAHIDFKFTARRPWLQDDSSSNLRDSSRSDDGTSDYAGHSMSGYSTYSSMDSNGYFQRFDSPASASALSTSSALAPAAAFAVPDISATLTPLNTADTMASHMRSTRSQMPTHAHIRTTTQDVPEPETEARPLPRSLKRKCSNKADTNANMNVRTSLTYCQPATAQGLAPHPLPSLSPSFKASATGSPARKKFKFSRRNPAGVNVNTGPTRTHASISANTSTVEQTRNKIRHHHRNGSQTYGETHNRRNFAQAPASFRRALSLRSEAEADNPGPGQAQDQVRGRRRPHDDAEGDKENRTPTVRLNVISEKHIYEYHKGQTFSSGSSSSSAPDQHICPPTVPTTPFAHHKHNTRALRRDPRPHRDPPRLSEPVPIIAPPAAHLIPRAPVGEHGRAEVRLERFLEREAGRIRVGRKMGLCGGGAEGVREERRLWDAALGVGAELRREVVSWILDVLPGDQGDDDGLARDQRAGARGEGEEEDGEGDYDDLYDQLATSAETRFHAAYMFIWYFYCVMEKTGSGSGKGGGTDGMNLESADEMDWMEGEGEDEVGEEGEYDDENCHDAKEDNKVGEKLARKVDNSVAMALLKDGRRLITWDIAMGCMALSVKLHRDVLPPLNPVYASDFLSLAPHHMTYDDLEVSQRDILSTFTYTLGDTPQLILDELWLALSSLRSLLDFKGGWSCAMRETWWRLFEAILEPDILRFRISLLTAGALIDGIIASLVGKYELEAEEARWRRNAAAQRRLRGSVPLGSESSPGAPGPRAGESERARRTRRAAKAVGGVVRDIQAVLVISDDDLRDCRRWFSFVDE